MPTEKQPHKNVHFALLAARAGLKKPVKNAENKHFGNKYADLEAVFDAAMPALNREGIIVLQPVIPGEVIPVVKTILFHPDSDTSIETEVPLYLGSRNDMQSLKSASTYARRVGLENLIGLAPSDGDDDAEVTRSTNPMTEALNDAWVDGVLDRLPENASPREKAEAFAKQICEDFKRGGSKALTTTWNKRKKMVAEFEKRFPDLHAQVVDAYENRSIELADKERELT